MENNMNLNSLGDTCPRCGKRYELCICASEPATRGAANQKIAGRTLIRAAIAMQRLGLPFATGAERDVTELDIDTGRVTGEYFEPARRKYDRKYEAKRTR